MDHLHLTITPTPTRPPGWQLHPHHPLSNISTLPPLHTSAPSQLDLSRPSDGLVSNPVHSAHSH